MHFSSTCLNWYGTIGQLQTTVYERLELGMLDTHTYITLYGGRGKGRFTLYFWFPGTDNGEFSFCLYLASYCLFWAKMYLFEQGEKKVRFGGPVIYYYYYYYTV